MAEAARGRFLRQRSDGFAAGRSAAVLGRHGDSGATRRADRPARRAAQRHCRSVPGAGGGAAGTDNGGGNAGAGCTAAADAGVSAICRCSVGAGVSLDVSCRPIASDPETTNVNTPATSIVNAPTCDSGRRAYRDVGSSPSSAKLNSTFCVDASACAACEGQLGFGGSEDRHRECLLELRHRRRGRRPSRRQPTPQVSTRPGRTPRTVTRSGASSPAIAWLARGLTTAPSRSLTINTIAVSAFDDAPGVVSYPMASAIPRARRRWPPATDIGVRLPVSAIAAHRAPVGVGRDLPDLTESLTIARADFGARGQDQRPEFRKASAGRCCRLTGSSRCDRAASSPGGRRPG